VSYQKVWRQERDLWRHAIFVDPTSAQNWLLWAGAEKQKTESSSEWLQEELLRQTLKRGVPASEAAPLFLEMAKINLKNQRENRARDLAARAITLSPSLQKNWDEFKGVKNHL
jgi:hypothetical protein